MNDVVIVGAGPNGLMLACELGLAGIRPIVVDPLPGPNPNPRANGITGQGVRILDHRGLYSVLAGTSEPPRPAGDVAATALLVRPDGYVAWASSAPQPEVGELRCALSRWPGVTAP
jgi:2-polyprenyl-6-methoxyphenol hydroxylase-like FAD-dependent oxidoreductase